MRGECDRRRGPPRAGHSNVRVGASLAIAARSGGADEGVRKGHSYAQVGPHFVVVDPHFAPVAVSSRAVVELTKHLTRKRRPTLVSALRAESTASLRGNDAALSVRQHRMGAVVKGPETKGKEWTGDRCSGWC